MTRSLTAAIGTPKTCPFLIMFIISYPRIVRRAVLKEANPIPGLTNRLIPRWSCSNILILPFGSISTVPGVVPKIPTLLFGSINGAPVIGLVMVAGLVKLFCTSTELGGLKPPTLTLPEPPALEKKLSPMPKEKLLLKSDTFLLINTNKYTLSRAYQPLREEKFLAPR